jgi:hypothetical protein
MNVRMVVGAVYSSVTRYRSTMSHQRSRAGVSGVPSYMSDVAPFASGPYTMYEWPVTQPMSAAHHHRSDSGLRSKTSWWVHEQPVR